MIPLYAEMNSHWYLPPLVIAVSLVYSATRFEEWRNIWIHSVRWAVYILSFLAGAYVLLYLVSANINPYLFLAIVITLAIVVLFFNRRDEPTTET